MKIAFERPTQAALRRRIASIVGAVLLALMAIGFARLADAALELYGRFGAPHTLAMVAVMPLAFGAITWATARYYPDARSSGIPQIIVVSKRPETATTSPIVAIPTGIAKILLTSAMLAIGAPVGREGPTVQVAAAINVHVHRWLKVPITPGVLIAGGAAGVAAAFNTPLAGVAFAIEELASAYEQRMAALVMMAVMIAGFVTLGLAGDYLYFGAMHGRMTLRTALIVTPILGIVGGLAGGLFSRVMQFALAPGRSLIHRLRARPALFAALCGLVVGLMLWLSGGNSAGTGYGVAKALIEGTPQPLSDIATRAAATLATAISGVPGGIFVPSLTLGAEIGNIVARAFPPEALGPIALIGMVAYFTGVVRAPLTAVIIASETAASHSLVVPLFAAALIADGVSTFICPEKLYHGLAKGFAAAPDAPQ